VAIVKAQIGALNIYVSANSGDDSNDGSAEFPYRTIDAGTIKSSFTNNNDSIA
jgi:hypothetical protein